MTASASRLLRLLRPLADTLRAGNAGTGALEWLRPETVEGLSIDTTAARQRIVVHVEPHWPLGIVPQRCWIGDTSVDLLPRRVERPRAQCATVRTVSAAGVTARIRGTAGFLANDQYAAGINFLVTAGHVLGAPVDAAFNDPLTVESEASGIRIERAFLAETATPLAAWPGPYPVDAGLIRLRSEDWRDLVAGVPRLVPRDVASDAPAETRLRLLRAEDSDLVGSSSQPEAQVIIIVEVLHVDGTTAEVPLRVDTLGGWRLDAAAAHGDSGAPIRDSKDDLVGIHCAYRDTDDASTSNALYTPARAILDHFGIVALTQATRNAPLPPQSRPGLRSALPRPTLSPAATATTKPPAQRPSPDEVVDTLARTLWAEARGEGDDGMSAVACVVLNRVALPRWWGRTIVEVCRKPLQFSCWNEGTRARAELLRVTPADVAFARASAISTRAASGQIADFTRGATHYHAIEVLPPWARGKTPCFRLGRHVFYNDI